MQGPGHCRGRKFATLKCVSLPLDYIELKTIQAPKTQEESLTFLLTAKKNNQIRVPVPRIDLLPETCEKDMGQIGGRGRGVGGVGGNSAGPGDQSALCSIVSV